MKKIKKLSDEFVISVGLLLVSFFIFQGAILPGMVRGMLSANVALAANPYALTPSTYATGAFSFKYLLDTSTSKEELFDIPIAPFNDRLASGSATNFIREFGLVRDAWNYPLHENIFMKGGKAGKDTGQAKSDNDANVVGLVNCRANPNVTGYFKAYFEDVALGNGVGYDDQVHGQARRDRACQVLQDIAVLIKLDQGTVTPDILFTASQNGLPPGALAAASAYYGYENGDVDNGSLHKHIISHVDPTPAAGNFDAFVLTNWSGVNWDVDSNLNISTYSFYTVLYHEVMHALGFRGLLPATILTTNDAHEHGTFDANEFRDNTLAQPFFNLINQNLQVPTGTPSAWFINNQVVYRGIKNLIGAVPDAIDPVFSPLSWQQGSSLSHFDMARSNGEIFIMHPSLPTNTVRPIHAEEKNVLCHLGYQVTGVAGCNLPTPLAENDSYLLTGNPVCMQPLTNDHSFYGNPFLMTVRTLTPVSIQIGDVITYYASVDCSGVSLGGPSGARSIRFTPSANPNPRELTYTVIDSSNRFSFPAHIGLVSCTSAPGEHVCNGTFEMNLVNPYNNASFDCGETWNPANVIPWWCQTAATPQLTSVTPDGSLRSVYGWQMARPNSISLNQPLGWQRGEGFLTQLNTPLIPGQAYVVSFDARAEIPAADLPFIASTHMEAGFKQTPTMTVLTSLIPDLSQVVTYPDMPIAAVGAGTWTHLEQVVTATGPYEYLSIYGVGVPTSSQGQYYPGFFVDNVSVRPAPSGTNTVEGLVYHDTNANHIQDNGETGLDGVAVGIFHTGETVPFVTVSTGNVPNLGVFTFPNLPNGTYNIALSSESSYTITQPGVNTLIPGYAHAYQVTVQNGQTVSAGNIGISLNGDSVSQGGKVDIAISKSLLDSTLSNTDRTISFRVLVQNNSTNPATNVLVHDAVPSGLAYVSSTLQAPNTYTVSTGSLLMPTVSPGQTIVFDMVLKVPVAACGVKTNTASLVSLSQSDNNTTNNQASANLALSHCLGVAPVIKK